MDKLLHKIRNVYAFVDDNLIVTKGTYQQHMEKVKEVTKNLDEAGIRLKLENWRILKTKTEWLSYKLSESGVKPMDEQIQVISDQLRPTTLKELR